jgi:aspartate carbamoyltransferase catalytic subunit
MQYNTHTQQIANDISNINNDNDNQPVIKNLISINDLTKDEILSILALALQFKNGMVKNTLSGKIIAACFFEASTRTRLSFESAILRLGGRVIGFANNDSTSLAAKGESFIDTMKVISGYADAIILRHPADGAARLASEVCSVPIINAGDGANQHPTQTLLDLFSILETQGQLDEVHLGIMGDLRHSRTVHSLIRAAQLFNMKLYFIAPKFLRVPDEQLLGLKQCGIQYSYHDTANEIIDRLDCLYLTRLQKERFINLPDSPDSSMEYGITMQLLSTAKPNLKILHPLPRQSELPVEIDNTPYAHYFIQAQNGLYVRQALLDILFT